MQAKDTPVEEQTPAAFASTPAGEDQVMPSPSAHFNDLTQQQHVEQAESLPTEWTRRWFFVPSSVSVVSVLVTHDNTSSSNAATAPDLSLLAMIALFRMVASVDVALEGQRLSVSSVSTETPPEAEAEAPTPPSTALQLDGRVHVFESFPNGLSVAAGSTLFGASCDWRADRQEDGGGNNAGGDTSPDGR
ncbi:unnamed protein product [Phytophthora fragariaefolia]|uniref:Unnamed protein product n=1 Tax=Phytophthora fragariaefolia TaxID=1490495 RepID=A0A9W6YMF8_9STRA|nr:unnamed protein product [Phytophthora fragariaefolia]